MVELCSRWSRGRAMMTGEIAPIPMDNARRRAKTRVWTLEKEDRI
jgi:hypothetical protein